MTSKLTFEITWPLTLFKIVQNTHYKVFLTPMEVIELSHDIYWNSHLGLWRSLRYKDKVRDFDLKIFLTESEKSVFIPVNVDKDRPHDKRSFICLCHFSSCLAYRLQYKNLFKENCKENQVAFTLFKFRLQYTQYSSN